MPMIRISVVVALFLSVVFLAFPVSAEIKKADLQKRVFLTEEAELLTQVDTISLYLSSDRVVFAPRLTKSGAVEVEATVLSPDLIADAGKMQSFISRLVDTFISVLNERLPIFAPMVARTFDSSKDIIFIVNAGAERKPVGVWKGGMWQVEQVAGVEGEITASSELNQARAIESESTDKSLGRKGCGCPVRK